MADSIVDPIVDKIFKACSVYLKDQYRWQTGMKEELEKLRENYPNIRAAYTQAQIRDQNSEFNRWIWQLRDAIDEADDVLDDFEYEKLKEQLTGNKKRQKAVKAVKKIGKRALMMDPNLKRLEKVVKKLDTASAEVTKGLFGSAAAALFQEGAAGKQLWGSWLPVWLQLCGNSLRSEVEEGGAMKGKNGKGKKTVEDGAMKEDEAPRLTLASTRTDKAPLRSEVERARARLRQTLGEKRSRDAGEPGQQRYY